MGSCSYRLLLMELVPEKLLVYLGEKYRLRTRQNAMFCPACKADSEHDMLSDVRMCDW
jgi:hypothetical protein